MTEHFDAVTDPPEPRYDHDAAWESAIRDHTEEIHALIMHIIDVRDDLVFAYRQLAGGFDVPLDDCGFDFLDSFVFNELVSRVGWPDAETEKRARLG